MHSPLAPDCRIAYNKETTASLQTVRPSVIDMVSVQDLAQELVDIIIDFLHDEKPSLRACSLVCSRWTCSAHHHLFYSHRVEARHDQGGYIEQIKKPCTEPLRSYIRELTLAAGPIHSLSPELTEDIVVQALENLPHLRLLKLRQTGFITAGLFPVSQNCYDLERLSISWMYPSIPGTGHGLVSLLSMFHTVHVLDLDVIHHKHLTGSAVPSPDDGDRLLRSLRVHTLQLHDISEALIASVQATIRPEYLQTIRASITATEDIQHLGALIWGVASSLQELQISLWNFWCGDRADWKTLQLTGCTKLRSATVLYANCGPFYNWNTVLDILQVFPATVEDITLVIREVRCLDGVNWVRMATQLKRFSRLKTLQFALCTSNTFRSRPLGDEAKQRIWGAMPEWKARHVLW